MDDLHLNRGRAESFGAIAAAYERYRPGYPAELFDDLVTADTRRVLDVGCGTGRVARALQDRARQPRAPHTRAGHDRAPHGGEADGGEADGREPGTRDVGGYGLDVVGIEVDPRMAEVARGHGVRVEVGRFETWDAAGRTFDLITCGQAWHWIDPAAGGEQASQLLRPGGTLAVFWNAYDFDDELADVIDGVYRQHVADQPIGWRPGDDDEFPDPVAGNPAFERAEERRYRWDQRLSPADWVALVATASDHLALPPDRLTTLQDALREALEPYGDRIVARYWTVALILRRR